MKTIKTNTITSVKDFCKTTTLLLLFSLFTFCGSSLSAQSIVQTHGRLQVVGNKVMNQFSQPISLAGNSLFWDNFGGSIYYNAATVNHLATEWNTDIVRPAMGVEEFNAYTTNSVVSTNNVIAVVDAAIAAGIYVIIDFHSHYANDYEQDAITFFTTMASTYGSFDNVIYEVFNEPIDQSWPVIKAYSEAVISAIRAQDPDNLIIVGSRQYSQDVDEASLNPINDPNVAYALHFYSGTHTQYLRDKATVAMNNGIALFATEWGAVNADGDGPIAAAETEIWMDYLRDNDISHANWSVFDKDEGASSVAPNAGLAGLLNNNLTNTGFYVRDIIENWNAGGGGGSTTQSPYVSQSIPGRIQLEDYDIGGQGVAYNDFDAVNNGDNYRTDGVDIGGTSDIGGGFTVGWTEDGEWLEYTIANVSPGDYDILFRVASITDDLNRINISLNGTSLGTVTVPNTGGYESWTTVTLEDIALTAGTDDIVRVTIEGGGFNLNWVEFENTNPQSPFSTQTIPGRLQVEDYDNGGQGIAYNDTDPINNGDSYRTDGVDIELNTDVGGGHSVAYTEDGEWLEYSMASVAQGQYDLSFRVATISTAQDQIDVSLDGVSLGNITVPNTGGYDTWSTVVLEDVTIPSGSNQIIRMTISGGGYNINWIDFTPVQTNPGECTDADNMPIEITEGDVYLTNACYGVILTSPSGQCFRVTIADDGQLVSTAIECP